jgi:hypothetical protein
MKGPAKAIGIGTGYKGQKATTEDMRFDRMTLK